MKVLGVCAAALGGLACGDLGPLGAAGDAGALAVSSGSVLAGLLGAALAGRLAGHRHRWLVLALLCAAALGFARASLAAPAERGPPVTTAVLGADSAAAV